MKRKKVIIALVFFILVLFILLTALWYHKNSTTLSYVNQIGEERNIFIPAIPGIEKQEELVTICSSEVEYDITISQVPPLQASPQIIEIIKPRMQAEGWVVKEENKIDGFLVVIFNREEEKLTATTGAKDDLPVVKLLYEWPPCSLEIK